MIHVNLNNYAAISNLSCDDSNWEDSTQCIYNWTISGVPDGNYFIDVNVWDSSASSVDSSNSSFMVDTNAPVTSDNAPLGWQSQPVTVVFSCDDNSESGCSYTRYSVDSGSWATGSSVKIYSDGNHSIQYYSVDRAGNIESTNTTYVAIMRGDHNFSVGFIFDGNYRSYTVKIPGFVSDQNVQLTSTQVISNSSGIDYVAFHDSNDLFGLIAADKTYSLDITNVNPSTFNVYFHQRYDSNSRREIWLLHSKCSFSDIDEKMPLIKNNTFLSNRKLPSICFTESAEYRVTVGLDYYNSSIDINSDLRLPKGTHRIRISNAGVSNNRVVLNFTTT